MLKKLRSGAYNQSDWVPNKNKQTTVYSKTISSLAQTRASSSSSGRSMYFVLLARVDALRPGEYLEKVKGNRYL